jgi:hypothetical protein
MIMEKKMLLIIVMAVSALAAQAQDVVKWTFSANKTGEKTYEVHLLATLEAPWKIYSQHTPAGGPLPTKIKFDKNPLVIMQGKVKELGQQEKKFERAFDVDVLFYHGQVDFVQTVRLKTAVDTFISGNIDFMSCNETQCLPAAKTNFKIELK